MDLSADLQLSFPATSPNLLAHFVRIVAGESLPTGVDRATSQLFYVIRGQGMSKTRAGDVAWKEGDLFVLPHLGDNLTAVCEEKSQCVKHFCREDPHFGGCALYWVHDEPLLKYLGVRPDPERRFEPTLYPGDVMKDTVAAISNVDEKGHIRNRRGILLGNTATPQTKTVTPTMWSLLNTLGGHATQDPHKHNSVALDLAVSAGQNGKVYTLLGRSLDANGTIVDPQRAEWKSGGVFVTPPGWWHSHHNEGNVPAWVLPVQDAGLYTHQRTLDIRFMGGEVEDLKKGTSRGATLPEPDSMSADVPPMVAGTITTGHI
jgi:gentisate 1,2-dioxygenase